MSTLHALLIGIDDYFPDHLPDGSRYPSLQGATRDVECMETLLRDQEGLKPENTCKLLSRAGEDGKSSEPPERRPTYTNIVGALKRLTTEAERGDRVYIHYSGHGARTRIEFPGAKGLKARHDEALVPCDIGDPLSRYLKDVELSVLLRLLADHGLLLTVVLDCCHSGGVMRNRSLQGAVARRVRWVSPHTVPSAVIDPRPFEEARNAPRDPKTLRHFSLKGWMPEARYEMFAACRPEELAFEYPFENGEPQGALTYWLLETLKRSPGKLRCGEIHQKLVAHVRGFFAYQTPVFLGDPGCGFLAVENQGSASRTLSDGPTVLRIGEDGRVLIDIGVATGAQAGGTVMLSGGRGEIDQVGATESWVKPSGPMKGVTKGVMKGRPEPGAPIEVHGHRAGIRLVRSSSEDALARWALERLAATLRSYQGNLREVVEEGEAADLCVTVGAQGIYEILDLEGQPLPNLSPLQIEPSEAAMKVLRRLEHLVKFRRVLSAENRHPPDWLRVGLELCGSDPDAVPKPLPSRGLVLGCQESLLVRIVNQSRIRLDVAVLDLAPDYSVTQLLPVRGSLSLVPLDPEQVEEVRITGWLPAGWQEGTDVLKVFATQGAASFRWLELPPLVDRPSPYRTGLTPSMYPEEEWVTTQAEILVRR